MELQSSESKGEKKHVKIHPFFGLLFQRHFEITWRVVTITLGTIFILGGVGYWIDSTFGTRPFGTIVGVFIAFPLSQILLVRAIRTFVTRELNEHQS